MFRFENHPRFRRYHKEFWSIASSVVSHPDYRVLKSLSNHGKTDLYEHSISVATKTYIICKYLQNTPFKFINSISPERAVRGALLHDFFLYDWRKRKGIHLHGFRHPKIALRESEKRFKLGKKERDIILHHMWPLTPVPPMCLESWVVSAMDKLSAVDEYLDEYLFLKKTKKQSSR